jgi:hypothetical protein
MDRRLDAGLTAAERRAELLGLAAGQRQRAELLGGSAQAALMACAQVLEDQANRRVLRLAG